MECSNPFVHKLELPLIQKVKIFFLSFTLLPIRLMVALICLTFTSLLAYVGLYGLTMEDIDRQPFTGWRLFFRKIICGTLRLMFFVCGFHHVKVIGKRASPREARMLAVAPHSTFFDALCVIMLGAPSVVAKVETSSVPFWGSLIKYTQPVLVHRSDPNSRQNTIKHIKERCWSDVDWQQVLIFPEGTCTNRSSYITFQQGAFLPGAAVQPVIIRYDNSYDTVTWTWEGFPAWKVIVYSLSQLNLNCSIEFMDPYVPSQDEVKDAKLFANNVRSVMAKRVGIPTTDCNYFDYLRIEKSKRRSQVLQKLQKKADKPLIDLTSYIEDLSDEEAASVSRKEELRDLLGISIPAPTYHHQTERLDDELIDGLCIESSTVHLRDIRLAILIASSTDSLDTFLEKAFKWWDPELGENRIAKETCRTILQTHLFLNDKSANEACNNFHDVIEKSELQIYITQTKPNHLKVLKAAEDTLVKNMTELLTKTAGLTAELMAARLEKVAASGSSLVSDMSATVVAGREKVSDVLTSATTSLHKRMGSYSEKKKE